MSALTDYFKTRSTSAPVPAAAPSTHSDAVIAAAWGMTREGWALLTDELRKDYRDRVVYAPYFNR